MSLARLITRSTYKKKKKIKFLHNSNEQQETEFLKTIISHTINDMKCLAVNWTKYVQDLCAKTTKHLKKKDMNKWSDILCSHILMLNTMKISILPNYRFKTRNFYRNWQTDSKIYTYKLRNKNIQVNFGKRINLEDLHSQISRLTIVIKTVRY